MKKFTILVLASILFVGCADGKNMKINGTYRYVDTYGLMNESQNRDSCVIYEPSIGSIIVGGIFFETVIAPIYIFGFDVMEPIAIKSECEAN